jgi:tetratricopeptide (TPR) repeat protein
MTLDTAETYNNLGNLYKVLGQNDKALEYLEKDLIIQKKLIGENDPSLSQTFNNMGTVYKALKEFDKAIYSFERSLYLKKKGPRVNDYH